MERRYVREFSGAEIRDQDITIMADGGALADDRVMWELLRIIPGSATPDKGILPYAVRGNRVPALADGFTYALHNTALVQGNKNDGKVRVMPFRAVVGSTTLFATSPIEKLRGIRSGYLVGASALFTEVTIAANASGNPRWTLVYAVVTPDADGDTLTLKAKALAGGAISDQVVTVNRVTGVTVTTVDGATGANPTQPALPADGAGNYYIALAYVFVPTGFGATSTVHYYEIQEVAPVLTMSSGMGVTALAPANQSYTKAGTIYARQNPNGNAAKRPGAYLPSTMVGAESRDILIQLGLSPVSHLSGDVVDSSCDWRQRYFEWRAYVAPGTTSPTAFASDANGTGAVGTASEGRGGSVTACAVVGVGMGLGCGQSFVNDYPGSPPPVTDCSGLVVAFSGSTISNLGTGSDAVYLYVQTTTGNLMLVTAGAPSGQIRIRLDATAQYSNSNSF